MSTGTTTTVPTLRYTEHSTYLPCLLAVRLGGDGWVGEGEDEGAESLGSVGCCSLAQQRYMNMTTPICPTTPD